MAETELKSLNCPNCGAHLDVTDDALSLIRCHYCGTTFEREVEDQGVSKPVVRIPMVDAAPSDEPSKGAGVLIAILFAIGLLIGAGVVISTNVIEGSITSFFGGGDDDVITESTPLSQADSELKIYSFRASRILLSDDDSQPDFVAVTSNADDTDRMVYVDFDSDPPLRWLSEPLEDGAEYTGNKIDANNDQIFFVFEEHLVSFDRNNGNINWRATLSDQTRSVCEGCLLAFPDRVVVLTVDGMLQGFDAYTGEQIWIERLNQTPLELHMAGAKPAVFDEQEEEISLTIYEPTDGSVFRRIEPTCPNEPFPNDPQSPSLNSPLLVSPNGQSLYFLFGFFEPGCVQRWELEAESPTWSTITPVDIVRSLEEENYLIHDKAILITNDQSLKAITLAEGSYSDLFEAQDFDLFPIGISGETVILEAVRTRGTRRSELWGVDFTSGELRWQHPIEAQDRFRVYGTVADQSGYWEVRVFGEQVYLLEAFSDPNRIKIQVLDGVSGDAVRTLAFPIEEESSLWIDILDWQPDRLWLTLNNQVHLLEMDAGETLEVWPR